MAWPQWIEATRHLWTKEELESRTNAEAIAAGSWRGPHCESDSEDEEGPHGLVIKHNSSLGAGLSQAAANPSGWQEHFKFQSLPITGAASYVSPNRYVGDPSFASSQPRSSFNPTNPEGFLPSRDPFPLFDILTHPNFSSSTPASGHGGSDAPPVNSIQMQQAMASQSAASLQMPCHANGTAHTVTPQSESVPSPSQVAIGNGMVGGMWISSLVEPNFSLLNLPSFSNY